MTRGPLPNKAIDAAMPIAQLRGQVRVLLREPDKAGHFMITGPSLGVVVSVCRIRRLPRSPKDVELEFADTLSLIRRMLVPPGFLREIWLLSQHGTWCFFRVDAAGLVELAPDGKLLLRM